MRRPAFHLTLALGTALIAAFAMALPAAAETVTFTNGYVGPVEFKDQSGGPYGAVCKYETASYDLDSIRVRPPQNMHGNYHVNTKVQWRFKVFRQPSNGGSWTRIYTSTWQADTANDAIPADGFTFRTWVAPENPTGRFQVRLFLNWFDKTGHVEGVMKVRYDWYRATWNGNSTESMSYCIQDY